jgi:AraC-like DNA-binding protein
MKPSTEQDYRERIVRTLVYIQQHLDDDLELDQVAGVAAFSSFHFHRIFRGLVGETLKEYIRRLRLERAARNLKLSGEPITLNRARSRIRDPRILYEGIWRHVWSIPFRIPGRAQACARVGVRHSL